MKVFFAGMKAFKKIFIPVLPISAVFFLIQLSISSLSKTYLNETAKWWVLCLYAFVFPLLSIFCSYWATCFVYDKLTKQNTSYKIALETVAKRFLKTLSIYIIPLLAIAALIIIAFFSFKLINHYLPIKKSIFSILSLAITTILFPTIVCFFITSKIEVLLKNTGVFSAMKKAIKISFKIDSAWRMLCFIIIIAFLATIVITPFAFLSTIKYLKLDLIFANFFLLLAVAIYIPLSSTLFIYLYNDLILRFENRQLKNPQIIQMTH